MGWAIALVAVSAAHAGFQATVALVVYPALGRVPDEGWRRFHAGHSRGIAPLVGLLYGGLLLTWSGAALVGPRDAGLWLAAVGIGLALATTALRAAPLHGRLAAGPRPDLLVALRRADAVRTSGAALAALGAVWHLLVCG